MFFDAYCPAVETLSFKEYSRSFDAHTRSSLLTKEPMQWNQNRIKHQPTVPVAADSDVLYLWTYTWKTLTSTSPHLALFFFFLQRCKVDGVLFFFPRMRRTNKLTANTNFLALLQHLPQPFFGWIRTPWCKWPGSSFSSPVAQIRTLTWACHTSLIAHIVAAYGQTLIRARFFSPPP